MNNKQRGLMARFGLAVATLESLVLALVWSLAAIGLLSGAAHASTVVVPNSLTATGGNSNNTAPFSIGSQSFRYQQAYRSSEFPGRMRITGIRFRPDAQVSGSGSSTSTLPNVQINLSTTSRAIDALNATFSANTGSDDTVVFSGPLSLSSANSGEFDIVINFSTPFTYDPALGNLLLDVRNFGGGVTTLFDAHIVSADSVSRVLVNNVLSSSGSQDTLGLVTQFVYTTNQPPVANAGPDQSVAATSSATTAVTLNGSISSDPDGDSLSYAWKEGNVLVATGANPAIQLPLGLHTLTLMVDDGQGGVASDAVTVNITYRWSNVLQPVNWDGTSIFKLGSTVPVKFRLTEASAGITNAVARLYYTKIGNGILGTEVEPESTAASSTGNQFRYDSTEGVYVFNWGTKTVTTGSGTYQMRIDLGDGAFHPVSVSLR